MYNATIDHTGEGFWRVVPMYMYELVKMKISRAGRPEDSMNG